MIESRDILVEAGVIPSSRSLFYAVDQQDETLCRLLVQHGANPFLSTTTTHHHNINKEQQLQ
jgi:hypothetical protein